VRVLSPALDTVAEEAEAVGPARSSGGRQLNSQGSSMSLSLLAASAGVPAGAFDTLGDAPLDPERGGASERLGEQVLDAGSEAASR
jgi:hypothetical protein